MKNDNKNKATHRLHIIAGQINGLEKMIENEKYCIDVINQSQAVREALLSLEGVILEHHLQTCVVKQMKGGGRSKAIKEILSVYKVSGKNGIR
ncbi:MAG: metal-sensitive transcriptional regulator [Parcubacteria group bacterium]|nr:metal-sensitive transcriptional regulator [Parcubacteria group bacterium]